jgi:hypothetical protein
MDDTRVRMLLEELGRHLEEDDQGDAAAALERSATKLSALAAHLRHEAYRLRQLRLEEEHGHA